MVLEEGTSVFPVYQDVLGRIVGIEDRLERIESWIREHLAEIDEDRSFRRNNIRSKEDMMKMLAELQRVWHDPSSSDMSMMQLSEMINQKLITASKETIAQEKEKLEEEAKKYKERIKPSSKSKQSKKKKEVVKEDGVQARE